MDYILWRWLRAATKSESLAATTDPVVGLGEVPYDGGR